jgi:DNA-binding transcriptional MerR regulator
LEVVIKTFTKSHIAALSGLSPRLVQFYTDEGVITPVDNQAIKRGRGIARQYSEVNLREFAILRELNINGITLPNIKMIFEYLRGEMKGDTTFKELLESKESYNYFYSFIVVHRCGLQLRGDDESRLDASFYKYPQRNENGSLDGLAQMMLAEIELDTSALVLNINRIFDRLGA